MQHPAWTLVILGLVIAGIGAIWLLAPHIPWLGRLPGGLALTLIGASTIFAAACGSSAASAAAMGTIGLPEMDRYKYSKAFATGTAAVGGTLAILIPPSVGFILYGLLTEQSIGKLFMAGIIPGLILAFLFAAVAYTWARLRPQDAPLAPVSLTFKEKLAATGKIWGMMVLILLVLGGIWLGWFTPTEGGAIGAAGAFLSPYGSSHLTDRQRRLPRPR